MRFPAKTAAVWAAEFHGSLHAYRGPASAHATAIPGLGSLNRCLDKIVLNHRRNDRGENILDTIMRTVENNGEVTLPVTRSHGNGWKVIAGIAAGIAAVSALAAAVFR
jgi:hypothetical protein